MRWPENISNEELQKITKQPPTVIEIKRRKWHCICHTLRKPTGSTEISTRLVPPGGSEAWPSQNDPGRGWLRKKPLSEEDMKQC
jgi:hypothetical protein